MLDYNSPFFQLSHEMLAVLTADGSIIAANPAFGAELGFVSRPTPITSIFQLVREQAAQRLRHRLANPQIDEAIQFPLDFELKDGSLRITKATLSYDPASRQFALLCVPFVTMSDDEVLRWRLALESTDAGFWSWDISTDVIYFSERLETMLGYKHGELPLKFSTLRDIVHPDDIEANTKQVRPFLDGTTRSFKFECRVRKKSGDYLWIMAMGSRSSDAHGRQLANGWHFDIQELKETEERLRRSEDRSQLLLQSIPDLLFVFDREGKYLEVQTSNEEKLVMPAEKIIGRYVRDFFPLDFVERWEGYLRKVVDERVPVVAEYDIDVQAGHAYFEARLFPRPDGTVVAIIRDITERHLLARQVQEQQAILSASARLTALGEMAGGIAHEINNPLTVAHAHASRLRDLAEAGRELDPEMVIRSAQKIESVCMRISRIIAGLRSIARDGDNDRFVLQPLRPIIDDALSLSTEKFKHKQIELRVDAFPEALTIECRSVQISQVIVNLLLNAQHAVEDVSGPRWIQLRVTEHPTAVEIRVSDSGRGIPMSIRDRIFDPFFTTKDVGKGTGLGLSVSASIAETHGGALYLDENEAYTTFVLILQKRPARPS